MNVECLSPLNGVKRLLKLPVLIALLCASGLAHAFSYRCDGITLGQALKEVSALTGTTLSASYLCQSEVVWIDVHDVTVAEFANKIHDITGIDWTEIHGAYALTFVNDVEVRLLHENETVISRALVGPLSDLATTYNRPADFNYTTLVKPSDKPNNPDSSPKSLDPDIPIADSLIRALMTKEGLKCLADVRLNTRKVYSTNPNLHRLPLPNQVRHGLEEGVQNFRSLLFAARKMCDRQIVPGIKRYNTKEAINAQLAIDPREMNLVVYRTATAYYLQIQYLDQYRNWVKSYESPAIGLDRFEPSKGTKITWPKVEATTDKSLREYATALATFDPIVHKIDPSFQDILNDTTVRPYPQIPYSGLCSPEVRKLMLDTLHHDPLAIVGEPFMKQIPHRGNFFAILPDDVAGPMAASLVKGDSDRFMNLVTDVATYQDGGWSIIVPASRLDTLDSRPDRLAMDELFHGMDIDDGLARLGVRCRYALLSPAGLSYNSFDYSLAFWLFERDAAQTIAALHDDGWYDYRIFGHLTFDDFDRLRDSAYSDPDHPPYDSSPLAAEAAEKDYFNCRREVTSWSPKKSKDITAIKGLFFDGLAPYRLGTTKDPFSAAATERHIAVNLDLTAAQGLAETVTALPDQPLFSPPFVDDPIPHLSERTLGQMQMSGTPSPYVQPQRPYFLILRKTSYNVMAFDEHLGRKGVYAPSAFSALQVVANYGGNQTFPMASTVFNRFTTVQTHTYFVSLYKGKQPVELGRMYKPTFTFIVEGQTPVGSPGDYNSINPDFIDATDKLRPIIDSEYGKRLLEKRNQVVPPSSR